MQIVMLLMNRLFYFFCFKPISLIFKISCLIFLARTSYSMSTGNGKNEQPWLISNLRGKTFTVSSLNPWLQTFSYRRVCVCQLLSCVQLFATPWAIDCQGPLSTEFSRQEYWSGLPFPSPGDLPTQGSNLCLLDRPHCQVGSSPLMSDSSRPQGLQHARPLCPSPSPGVCPNLCPLNQ